MINAEKFANKYKGCEVKLINWYKIAVLVGYNVNNKSNYIYAFDFNNANNYTLKIIEKVNYTNYINNQQDAYFVEPAEINYVRGNCYSWRINEIALLNKIDKNEIEHLIKALEL